jgi:hypothetical protein
MRRVVCAFLLVGGLAWGDPPDYAHAKELYDLGNAEMKDGKFADAARDYGAAFDITHDPVLFYKIANANEKAGHCDVALVYYNRYLKEAKPSEQFVALAKERIQACAGSEPPVAPAPAPAPVEPAPPPAPAPAAPPTTTVHPSASRNGAWLFVGGALASVTVGAVLAYSASSSEQDLKDLYVGATGTPTYDAKTAQRYKDLVDEGHRYQYLSWASFGVAGVCAVTAAVLFLRASGDDEARVTVVPLASPHEAGVAATVRF